jgi:hypothetical protein
MKITIELECEVGGPGQPTVGQIADAVAEYAAADLLDLPAGDGYITVKSAKLVSVEVSP